MKWRTDGEETTYREVEFYQFNRSPVFVVLWTVAVALSAAVLSPLILLSRASGVLFKASSELLSVVPSFPGFAVRYAFYRLTLASCGKNVLFDFGTVLYSREIRIGSNVTFGLGNLIQHCHFGNNVLVSDGCRFVGGTEKHNFSRTDISINRQGGRIRYIHVGDDCWIDCGSIVMANVGTGTVVQAGSVVTQDLPEYSICRGNPAKVVDRRSSDYRANNHGRGSSAG